MATRIAHGTTTAATVATVTLGAYYSWVQIFNRGGDDLYVSVDGSTAPTVGGDDFYVVPQNQSITIQMQPAYQWEQGQNYNIVATAAVTLGNGVVVPINQITTSFAIGTVWTFGGGGVLTSTAVANNGDTQITGNLATANIAVDTAAHALGTFTKPTTCVVKLISTAGCKYSVEGISL